jgi:predicted HAD superfamily phosphohydrolase
MIFIGDGLTDVPCMRVVKSRGGYSIAVYTNINKVQDLVKHGRVNFIAPANYTEGEKLDNIIKDIIIKISTEDKLATITKEQRTEAEKIHRHRGAAQKNKITQI